MNGHQNRLYHSLVSYCKYTQAEVTIYINDQTG